jgi:multidrug resistance protein, MATE family
MTHSILSRLVRLAGPVAVSRLGIMGMGVADTVIVGQLAPKELSHLALGWAPTGVFLVGAIGLLTGVQVLTARVIGENKPEQAGSVLRRGLVLGLMAGVFSALALAFTAEPMLLAFGIAPALAKGAAAVAIVLGLSIPLHILFVTTSFFLEGISRPTAGAVVMWLANIVNIVLNLAFVPEHGAVGSAWATMGARSFLVIALLGWVLWHYRGSIYGVLKPATSDAPGYRALLAVGAAAAVSQVAEAGSFGAMTVIAGRISEEAVAAFQISLNLLAVVFMIALGFAAATQVLVSEFIGARDERRAAHAGWLGLGANTASMIGAGVVLVLAAPLIARAYTADAVLVVTLVALMPLSALILAPDGGQVVAAAALRGRGDNWFPTASHILAYVLILPPLAFWLGEHLERGVGGILEAVLIASCVSVGVLVARFAWLTRRRGSSPLPA